MRIIELNIVEFGCLKDRHIELSKGLNVISGDNESGKSTVMLFIKFMLYGLPRKNARSFDRERSLSFSGKRSAGTMTLEHDGKKYTVERNAVSTGTKLNESLKITDLVTFEELHGEPGELFLGVPADVFENSCGVSQMRAADISKAGAASVIENMLVSADESIDVSRILADLDAVRKEYKLNRGEGGRLYDTERQISRLKVRKQEVTERYLTYNEMSTRLESKQASLSKATAELEEAERILTDVNNARTVRRFDELAQKKSELELGKKQLEELESAITHNGFLPNDSHVSTIKSATFALSEALKKYAQRKEEYQKIAAGALVSQPLADEGLNIENAGGKDKIMTTVLSAHSRAKVQKTSGTALVIAGAAGIVAAAAVFAVLSALIPTAIIAAAGIIGAVSGVLLLSASAKSKKQRDALCEPYKKPFSELDEHLSACVSALAKKRAADGEVIAAEARLSTANEDKNIAAERLSSLISMTTDVSAQTQAELIALAECEASRIYEFCKAKRKLVQEIYALNTLTESLSSALSAFNESDLRAALTVDVSTLTPEVVSKAERMERFSKEKVRTLDKEVRSLRETLAGQRAVLSESPVELADKIGDLERRLASDTGYYNALVLAMKSIEQASMSMSGNVTPEISAKAGELLSLISDGKHASVQTTKSFDVSVEQDGFHVSADLLSGGTRDAAYICLRLALMQRLFGTELPPLILDEALCQLDDTRASIMLRLLSKLSPTLQILLFTCHSRELAICKELGVEVTVVRM